MTEITAKCNTAIDTSNINLAKPTRPYTEYNIFFQLEREYILQVELGVKPDLAPDNIFDPERDANYNGPSLPSRYNGLVLPSDWYVPGKEKRRKRKHKKTHGKIGFHELSNKIAGAWKNKDNGIDDETRVFCACLSDMGMQDYKKEMRKYKLVLESEKLKGQMIMEEDEKTKWQEANKKAGDVCADSVNIDDAVKAAMQMAAPQNAVANEIRNKFMEILPKFCSETFEPQMPFSVQDTKFGNIDGSAEFQSEVDLYTSFFNPEPQAHNLMNQSNILCHDNDFFCRRWSNGSNTSTATSMTNSSTASESMVDMHDNEILGMWQSSPEPTEHCEQSSRIVQICADAVTSGGLDHLENFHSLNYVSNRSSTADMSEGTHFSQSNMSQDRFSFPEPAMSNGEAQLKCNRATTSVSVKVNFKKDMENIERMRFLLAQQQSQLRKVTKRSLIACSA